LVEHALTFSDFLPVAIVRYCNGSYVGFEEHGAGSDPDLVQFDADILNSGQD
jgi:hypothetical protein